MRKTLLEGSKRVRIIALADATAFPLWNRRSDTSGPNEATASASDYLSYPQASASRITTYQLLDTTVQHATSDAWHVHLDAFYASLKWVT